MTTDVCRKCTCALIPDIFGTKYSFDRTICFGCMAQAQDPFHEVRVAFVYCRAETRVYNADHTHGPFSGG
jgi:ribosomal protein L40E